MRGTWARKCACVFILKKRDLLQMTWKMSNDRNRDCRKGLQTESSRKGQINGKSVGDLKPNLVMGKLFLKYCLDMNFEFCASGMNSKKYTMN